MGLPGNFSFLFPFSWFCLSYDVYWHYVNSYWTDHMALQLHVTLYLCLSKNRSRGPWDWRRPCSKACHLKCVFAVVLCKGNDAQSNSDEQNIWGKEEQVVRIQDTSRRHPGHLWKVCADSRWLTMSLSGPGLSSSTAVPVAFRSPHNVTSDYWYLWAGIQFFIALW